MKKRKKAGSKSEQILAEDDATLLDLLDDVLNKGVLVDGELVLGVADVDLIYLRLSTVLAAADRVLRGQLGDDLKLTPAKTKSRKR